METTWRNIIFENRIVSGIVSNDHTLGRISRTTGTHETDLTAYFIITVVHKNNSRLPTRAICELRNDNRLIDCDVYIGDWNGAQERVVSFVREKAQSRHEHRKRRRESQCTRRVERYVNGLVGKEGRELSGRWNRHCDRICIDPVL